MPLHIWSCLQNVFIWNSFDTDKQSSCISCHRKRRYSNPAYQKQQQAESKKIRPLKLERIRVSRCHHCETVKKPMMMTTKTAAMRRKGKTFLFIKSQNGKEHKESAAGGFEEIIIGLRRLRGGDLPSRWFIFHERPPPPPPPPQISTLPTTTTA